MNLSGARKAALAMATMHPADRDWMLSRMPAEWRAALKPLIADARRFTDLDAELLQEVLDGSEATSVVSVPSPAILIGVLDGLSNQWAARVLTTVAADHAEIYLAACSKLRGEAIRHEIGQAGPSIPRALSRALGRYMEEAGHALKMEGAR